MSEGAIPEAIAVFPLPGLVFLPGQRLPLHVFEPRYRAMVRDALAGSGWLAVACVLSAEGEEPAVFSPMATAGRIHAHQQLPDGRYNILVEGTARARLLEIPASTPYRVVRPQVQRDVLDDRVSPMEHSALLHVCTQLLRAARERRTAVDFHAPMELPPARLAMRLVDRFVNDPASRLEALHCESGAELVRVANGALAGVLLDLDRASRAKH